MRSRFLAVLIGGLLGVAVIADNFLKYKPLQDTSKVLLSWVVIVSGFSMLLGAVNMILVHGRRVQTKADAWDESAVLLACLAVTIFTGVFIGRQSKVFDFLFQNIVLAAGATIYASTVFWMASAAYRTFRVRNLTGALVLVSAFLVILGNMPVSASLSSILPFTAGWIVGPPTAGAQRGLVICGAVGAVSVGVRVLLGLERGNLGASRD